MTRSRDFALEPLPGCVPLDPSAPDVALRRVSIVLTVKNGMPYLPEAIESLRGQRYRDFELIVQDAGSTDGTLPYLRGISDFPISIVSEPDTGVGEARSRAYARCRTDLVGSIDADNLLHPDALSTAVAVFRQHPEAAAVYGAVELINPDGSTNSLFVPAEFDLVRLMACELVPPWSTAFFSRRVCGPHLFFDPSIPGCVDYDSWLRLGHLPILRVTDVLGCTRLGAQSLTCGIGNYDGFCTEKIHALERYVQRIEPAALRAGVLRHGSPASTAGRPNLSGDWAGTRRTSSGTSAWPSARSRRQGAPTAFEPHSPGMPEVGEVTP